jgi:hypothetical protein
MLKTSVRMTYRDTGWKRFRAMVEKARGQHTITLGIHGDAGGHDSGMSVVEIAMLHEFGSGHIPQRSFVRAWVEDNREKIDRAFAAMGKQLTKRPAEQLLEQLGSLFKASMQARISAGIAPELAKSTSDRKGSTTPLIDTGVLKASINYKVEAAS